MAVANVGAFLPGYAIIFNIADDRQASDRDVENLQEAFQSMNVTCEDWSERGVDSLKTTTSDQWSALLEDKYEYFIVVLLSHGSFDNRAAVGNGQIKSLHNTLVIPLNRIEAMDGKLKWIISSACKRPEAGRSNVLPDTGREYIFKMYASSEGEFAYRHPVEGSVFISVLCRILRENAATGTLIQIHEECVAGVETELRRYRGDNNQRPFYEVNDVFDFSFTDGLLR